MPRRVPYSEDVLRQFSEWYDRGFEAGYLAAEHEARPRAAPLRELRTFSKAGTATRGELKAVRKHVKKTKYQAAYSAAYKRLKKKHPRMAFGSLSKKAHAAARKKVK